MAVERKFIAIFRKLVEILEVYETQMDLKVNTDEQYSLDTYKINPINKKVTFFASIIINKNYVSYHLMPVYAYPDLLDDISDSLRKRMQGKSCFNFKGEDDNLFREIKTLTENGYTKYKEEDLV